MSRTGPHFTVYNALIFLPLSVLGSTPCVSCDCQLCKALVTVVSYKLRVYPLHDGCNKCLCDIYCKVSLPNDATNLVNYCHTSLCQYVKLH